MVLEVNRMDTKLLNEKIKIAKDAVANHEEPYKTEAFKIILAKLLDERTAVATTTQNLSQSTTRPKDTGNKKSAFGSFGGVSKHIYSLLLEGFFDKPQLLKEINSELEKNSCFYDIRVVDSSLRHVFVKNNKLLTRIKNGSRWAYVVKK
jgi:hypothetical protein